MDFLLETQRLRLRALRPEDAADIFELDTDPLVHQFLGNQPIQSMEEAEATIAGILQQYEQWGIGRWALEEKRSGAFVGWSGLKFVEDDESGHQNYYDLGYRLLPRFWGKGYATESAREALRFGFEERELTEIVGTVNELNAASRRVLEKCGLQFVKKYVWKNRIACDWLSLSAADWKRLRTS